MKLKQAPSVSRHRPGVTLIELSIVMIVLFAFIAMTFIGVSAWKRGADRSACVMNIRHMQMAVRGYANTNQLLPGQDVGLKAPPVVLSTQLVGPGRFLPNEPTCPGRGLYTLHGNVIPDIGTLYMTCSLAGSDEHVPSTFGTW